MNFLRTPFLALALGLAAALSALAQPYPYQNKNLPPEQRAADLLGRLTLEEKASLTMHASPAIPRLGIKQYNWWSEALHGIARNGSATVFPQPIGMASSFDERLIEEVFTAASDEARVKYLETKDNVKVYQGLTFWTPNINIFRDPRWGRGMETYGEDPFLTGRLGMAVVRGLQGPEDSPIRKTHACAKHYAVHSGLESNRHRFDAVVSERDLRETYLPAFKDLVTKAHVQEVMTAYNRFRGEPCAASSYLVDQILRKEWGYQGMVVSDCWAIPDFFEKGRHGFTDSPAKAAALAVHNGLDVECGSTFVNIPAAVEQGLLDVADLDRNLMRILTERFRLGEMDGSSPWDDLDPAIVEGPEHRALSLKMARESLVLLQNNGILPLRPGQKVAVIGPNADDAEMMWGNYNPVPKSTVTLLDAFKARDPQIVNFRGCGIIGAEYMPENNPDDRMAQLMNLSNEELEEVAKQYAININDVKAYARRTKLLHDSFLPKLDANDVLQRLEGIDVVVFAGGISPRLEGEEMPVQLPGFSGGDRTDLELPAVQRDLLKVLHAAGKKVILVNFSGCAIGLVPETESCDAILQAWYPGQEGGTAIVEALYGEFNPSGKLPVTFYRSVDQLPEVEDYNMEGHTYRYFRGSPLFPFGFGLSYTDFHFGAAKVQNGVLEFTVRNTGKRNGTEVVQLYVRKPGDVGGPNKTLRAFQRVTVMAGASATVRIPLDDEVFTWWSESAQNMVPVHGEYELLYGSSSADADLKKVHYKF
ncbi:MAG: glycoside hydrolase family 3 C-terminal domain-containing protein [Bacteroidales bacterium]|nr:glycoside hydrolase family 3 C-terminal domain-containing protein [Bacteroidales bacterium]